MSNFDESKHPRGGDPKNPGRFRSKTHAEADADLGTEEFQETIHAIVLEEMNWQHLVPNTPGYEDGIDEVLRQDVALRTHEYIQDKGQLTNIGGYVRKTARGMIRDRKRPKNRDSTDEMAMAIFKERKRTREIELGRELTSKESNRIAAFIRNNWDEVRAGKGKKNRRPKNDFHIEAPEDKRNASLDEAVVGLDGGAGKTLGDLLLDDPGRDVRLAKETEQQTTLRIQQSERRAGFAYLQAKEQLETDRGQKLSRQEEDALAAALIDRWGNSDSYRPRSDFHRRRSTFANPQIKSWSAIAEAAWEDGSQKAVARRVAWNVLAETSNAPAVELGSVTKKQQQRARRIMGETSVVQAINDWESGEDTPATEALFTPWPDATIPERQEITETFLSRPVMATHLWKSALGLCVASADEYASKGHEKHEAA